MSKRNKHWTEEELQYLKDNYPHNTSESVRMGLYKMNKTKEWTVGSVNLKANDLGLRKERKEKPNRNFSRGVHL